MKQRNFFLFQAGGAIPVLHRTTACLLVMVLTLLVCAGSALAQEGDTGRLKTHHLDSVVVKGHRLPFVMKHDTLEFNTSAFKLLPNAVVKDLLKKLPGVIVGPDGSITVNGKKVNKIQVDGRDFFASNMDAAIANLSAEVIDKVQVMDTKSEAQQRTLAVQPRNEEVTINLTLKKDKKNGLLGNITAGAGTRNRYAANGMLNAFGPVTRISFYGSAGNETSASSGGVQAIAVSGGIPSQGGFANNQSASVNLNTKYGKELTVDANYSYSHNTTNKQTLLNRLNLLQDSSFTYNSELAERSTGGNHQLSLGMAYAPDSLTVWNLRPSFSFGNTGNHNLNKAFSATTGGQPINGLESLIDITGSQYSVGNQLSFNTSTRNRKINVNIAWGIAASNKEERQKNASVYDYYTGGVWQKTDSIDQRGHEKQQGITNNVAINLSAKIARHLVAALDYSLDWNVNSLHKQTHRYNTGTGKYDDIDSLLSNYNRNNQTTQVPSFQLGYKTDRMSIALNTGMRFMRQSNHLLWKDSLIQISQQQFAPNVQFNYTISRNSSVYVGYHLSSSAPSAEQLSPVTDNTNPLYIKTGNPFLQTSIVHGFHAGLYAFKPRSGVNMSIMSSGSVTRNQVVNDVYYDSVGRQVSTYRNVNGTGRLTVSGNLGINRHIGEWNFTSSMNIMTGFNKEVSFVNRQQNNLHKLSTGMQLYMSVGYKEWFTVSPSANWNLTRTSYSLGSIPAADFNTQYYQLQLEVNAIKRMKFTAEARHNFNSQVPVKENRQITICNSSFTYRFLAREQLMLTAAVQDIFNRNRYVSTTIMDTYRESMQTKGLKRYLLITLAYSFNRLHGNVPTTPGCWKCTEYRGFFLNRGKMGCIQPIITVD